MARHDPRFASSMAEAFSLAGSSNFQAFKARDCRNCKGAGELQYIPLYVDPENEEGEPVTCPDCCGTGVEENSAEDLT